jgi:hypothetical protein
MERELGTTKTNWRFRYFTKNQWRILGGFGGLQTPPPSSPPKFRSLDKAESNSQFRGKYIRNNLTRIRLSLIFWVVSWKALPASYDPHSGIFFLLQVMTWRKNKVPKIKKILPYEMKFLVPNYSCLQNPCLEGYRPQIPVLYVLCPQLNLLNPPPRKKFLGTPLMDNELRLTQSRREKKSNNFFSSCTTLLTTRNGLCLTSKHPLTRLLSLYHIPS